MALQIYFQLVIKKWLEQRRRWSERVRGPNISLQSHHRRGGQEPLGGEETTLIQTRDSGAEGNKEVPDVYGTPH